jgi:hypothetical protein
MPTSRLQTRLQKASILPDFQIGFHLFPLMQPRQTKINRIPASPGCQIPVYPLSSLPASFIGRDGICLLPVRSAARDYLI